MWWDGLAADRAFLHCSAVPARWKSDRPMSRQEFEVLFPEDAACARYPGRATVAGRVRLPGLHVSQALGIEPCSACLGICGLSATDLGDTRHGKAADPCTDACAPVGNGHDHKSFEAKARETRDRVTVGSAAAIRRSRSKIAVANSASEP